MSKIGKSFFVDEDIERCHIGAGYGASEEVFGAVDILVSLVTSGLRTEFQCLQKNRGRGRRNKSGYR
ncbi:hypothetical protein DPMN_022094 [Dreissena polymorpha]|uniref:Uncharacterized protein n=1 Tax=Dreissena polymorpha TaxID=45954 RepID=A0A9D4SBH1_DREPO|nr:hypothetical protein DPMN_022094 [Dreissena polymorpha]